MAPSKCLSPEALVGSVQARVRGQSQRLAEPDLILGACPSSTQWTQAVFWPETVTSNCPLPTPTKRKG